MKHLCLAVVASMLGACATYAADKTWTGKISDSMCGVKHNTSAEHGGKKMSDRDCTLGCVKEHNAKYVFVSGGKVYNVANQDFAALQQHAGHTVEFTGETTGDAITVSKIAMPVKKWHYLRRAAAVPASGRARRRRREPARSLHDTTSDSSHLPGRHTTATPVPCRRKGTGFPRSALGASRFVALTRRRGCRRPSACCDDSRCRAVRTS